MNPSKPSGYIHTQQKRHTGQYSVESSPKMQQFGTSALEERLRQV
jgi:hypothetical protein